MRQGTSTLGLCLVALTGVPKFRHRLWRWWYDLLARSDYDGDLLLMNYGYVPLSGNQQHLELDPADEPFRYPLQLYDHVVSHLDLIGKDVVEIGCGRGGGAAFLAARYKPSSFVGIDLSPVAIARCDAAYEVPGLSFAVGRAEALPVATACTDLVINVESSHCYADMARFLSEVVRVLRPGGYLTFCDLRTTSGMAELRADIAACGLENVHDEGLNQQVVEALEKIAEQRMAMIEQKVPSIARRLMANFAGAPGTPLFDMLRNGGMEYRHWLLRKQLNDDAPPTNF